MSKTSWITLLVITVLIVGGFIAGRMYYYQVTPNTYVAPVVELKAADVSLSAISPRLGATDTPVMNQGVAVIDLAHDNALFIEELNVLFSKLVSRGYTYEIVTPDSNEIEGQTLLDKLAYANALVVPLPRQDYTDEEIKAINNFVDQGGRILIIADPTRTVEVEALNSIAGAFGIVYANDYLYSLAEESSDNNYRNVIYTNFAAGPLTDGLSEGDKVIFYSGSSVYAPGHEIILGDENTHSSTSEGGRNTAAAALAHNNQVLAVGDLTFFSEPYSGAESNGKFINNIANFLTGSQRNYELKDFPHFFNTNIDVVVENPLVFNSQFEETVKLKEALETNQHTVNFVDTIGNANDVIYIGRYDNTETVQPYLDAAGIKLLEHVKEELPEELSEPLAGRVAPKTVSLEEQGDTIAEDADQDFIEGRILIAGAGELELGGSTLFYLHRENGRNILIILSDTPTTNQDALELLMNQELNSCILGALVAVCQTESPDKKVIPSIRATRINKILVVSDDDGREREDAQTSLVEYYNALSTTYKVNQWLTSRDGSPDLPELQEYDAIIWTTGDYWDDSIGDKDTETLIKYIEAGGNLILSGASIAFDWDHTDFLSNIVHADYLTFAEQNDIVLALPEHPLARGFEPDEEIVFEATPSGEILEPDVVNHTANARAIFLRGSTSEQAGAASVIAYEDERAKIAYFAFPVYLLPIETQAKLINNTVDWFTRKPLDLPDASDYESYELDDGSSDEDSEDAEAGDGSAEEGEEGDDGGGEDEGGGEDKGDGNGGDGG